MVNAELSKINMWFQLNKLSINTTKYDRKPHKKCKIPVIKINQNELEYVETYNFLGVNLDKNISWKPQLSKVSNKIVRIIVIMNKLKFILPQNILSNIYNSLIMLHIIYCIFYGAMRINGFLNYRKKQFESYITNVASLIQIQFIQESKSFEN